MRGWIAALVVLTAAPALAVAGAGGDIELSAFRPAIDSRGYVTVDGADALESGQLSFGLVTTWARGLLRLDGDGATYDVDDVVTPTLIAAYGLPGGLELGLSMPFGVVSGTRTPIDDNGTPMDPYDDDRRRLAEQGLGDLGVHAKLELGRGALRGAVIGSALLPTASEAAWLGTGATSVSGRGVLEYRRGRLRTAVTAGVRTRLGGDAAFHDDPDPTLPRPMPTTGADIVVGPAATAGVAAAVMLTARIELVGESFAVLPLRGDGYRPVEALAGAKVYLAERSYLSLGGGVGLGGDGGNPDARLFLGIVFEPRAPRRVHVELPDDPGPRAPGRALDDRDGDRIIDSLDDCPDEPEDPDGFQDGDGCPDRGVVTVGETTIDIADEIHFDFNSAKIQERSFGLLDTIGKTIELNPQLLEIAIGGHTDDRGSEAYNDALSDARANAVRDHLIGLGVAADRLTAEGYGERRPKLRGSGEKVWRANRRVEFVITRRDD